MNIITRLLLGSLETVLGILISLIHGFHFMKHSSFHNQLQNGVGLHEFVQLFLTDWL